MVCVLTATTDELCSTPFPFRFMTGLWLVAPCSLPTTLPSFLPFLSLSLCAPQRCARNRWLACSRNCDLSVVSSRLVSNRVSTSCSSPQSLYVSFFSLAAMYVWNTSGPPPPLSSLPAPSVLVLCILRRRKKKLVLCCALLVVVCARVVAVAHIWRVGFQGRECCWERERERASLKTRWALSFVCALCVKIVYELGGRGYKGVLSSVVVHLLAFVGFQFLERETERTRAQEACNHIRQ
jgi:hypothetical protein